MDEDVLGLLDSGKDPHVGEEMRCHAMRNGFCYQATLSLYFVGTSLKRKPTSGPVRQANNQEKAAQA